MKFFDFEMDGCLALGEKIRSRSISFDGNKPWNCNNWVYTNGNSWLTCGGNLFTHAIMTECQGGKESIKDSLYK